MNPPLEAEGILCVRNIRLHVYWGTTHDVMTQQNNSMCYSGYIGDVSVIVGTHWERYSVIVGTHWERYSVIVGTHWERYSVIVGTHWERYSVIVGTHWERYSGYTLGTL